VPGRPSMSEPPAHLDRPPIFLASTQSINYITRVSHFYAGDKRSAVGAGSYGFLMPATPDKIEVPEESKPQTG
jgi:hypothetical protein